MRQRDRPALEEADAALRPEDVAGWLAAQLRSNAAVLHALQDDISALLPHLTDRGAMARLQRLDHATQMIDSMAGVCRALERVLLDGRGLAAADLGPERVLREVVDRLFGGHASDDTPPGDRGDATHWF